MHEIESTSSVGYGNIMKAKIIAVMRIPTHRNDGSKVSNRELQAILKRVLRAFTGFSLEGPFPGA